MAKRTATARIDIPADERMLTQTEVLEDWYPGHRSSLYRAWTRGDFPAPVVLSSGKIAWRLSQLRQHVADRQQHPIARRRYIPRLKPGPRPRRRTKPHMQAGGKDAA